MVHRCESLTNANTLSDLLKITLHYLSMVNYEENYRNQCQTYRWIVWLQFNCHFRAFQFMGKKLFLTAALVKWTSHILKNMTENSFMGIFCFRFVRWSWNSHLSQLSKFFKKGVFYFAHLAHKQLLVNALKKFFELKAFIVILFVNKSLNASEIFL